MKKKILIIDDKSMNIKVLKSMLKINYNMFAIADSTKSIEAIKKIRPDMVLLDVNMSKLNGLEVAKLIKSNKECKETPIIFISAVTDKRIVEKAFKLGAVDYIFKPFSISKVIEAIASNIEAQGELDLSSPFPDL